MKYPRRKLSVKSVRRREPLVSEDVLRAVLCDAKTEDEIADLTGGSRGEIDGALELLVHRNLVRKTEAGYEPVLVLRRQRRA